MRYEDASHTGAFTQGSEPDARNDADAIAAGASGPATGNVITGEGTQTGPSGSDYGPGAHITSIAGAGGEDSSFAGGKLAVSGEFGRLSIDAEGNYSYEAKKGTPENSRDSFTYTLADSQGNADTATLMIEIGKTPAVIKANAQQVVPGPDGVVILPPGVELSDIQVVGRNLVINLPDGSQMVIIDGAVFVPQLVLGGVEVPATNLAALLVGQEIAPAAGEGPPQSSGGNFDVPVPPLDPGIPLGDLLPPTELFYTPPEVREVFDLIDEEPEIFIQPDGQPASVAAVDSVDEKGLPERNEGEPEGSGEEAAAGADGDPSEATGGTIVINSPDGVDSLTITGADGIPHEITVGLVVHGAYGTLTITGAVGSNFTYSYVLDDNIDHSDGAADHDDFSVTLTDNDGDQATATLQIDIADDTPSARPDTDVVPAGEFGPVTGNVITDDSAGDEGDGDNGRDTVGADDADLTAITGFGSTEPTEGGFIVQGQYGVLTISSDGEYSYLRNEGTPGGVTDVFNYTLTDGDGDTSATTLTITIENATPETGENPLVRTDDDAVPGADGNPGTPEVGDDVDADNLSGTLAGSGGDGPLEFDLLTTGAPAGFTYVHGPNGSVLVQQVQDGVTVTVLTITIDPTNGDYSVTQNAPIEHPSLDDQEGDDTENNVSFTINYTVTDQDDDSAPGSFTINVDDDTPIASEAELGGTVDEDGVGGGIAGGVNDVAGADVEATGNVSELFSPGADQPLTYSLSTDTSGLPALTSGGVLVTYEVVGNTLTASAGGTPVFTFTLNAETGAYTFTLLEQLDHPTEDGIEGADDTENLADIDIPLGSIIQATDADGDSVTANDGSLVITVDDDTPTASDIEVNQLAEDANVVVNIISSIAGGADGVDLADVTFSAHDGSGNLTYDDAGEFTYDPAPGEEGIVSFTYTIIDADGDKVTKEITINLAPDSEPLPTAEVAFLDDDGLPAGNPASTANDINANVGGDGDSNPSEAIWSGAFNATFGNDTPGSFSFDAGLTGDTAAVGQEQVTYTVSGDGLTLTANISNSPDASRVGDPLFTVQITNATTGAYTVTLVTNVLHLTENAAPGDDTENLPANDASVVIPFTATDSENESATANLTITFDDDAPTASDIEVNQVGEDTNVVVNIVSSIVEGADGVDLADVTFSAHNGSGNLTYDDAGEFTYDPAPGEEGIVSFTYTIVDADGDKVTKEITINLGDDDTPVVGTPDNLVVDEDGLTSANVDSAPLQSDPGETNSTESDTATGDVVVDFGDDVPADLPGSIVLLDNGALDGQLVDLDGNNVTFALVAGQLVGSTVNGTVMIISITGAVAGPGAGEVTYTYEAELLQPVKHADAGNNENTDILSGVQFEVTDSDGDPATGSFNVTVVDDVPSLENVAAGDGVTLDESNFPFAISDTSLNPVIDATKVFGADGEAASNATVYGLEIVGGDGTDSGLATAVGDHAITLEQIDGDTIEGHYNGGQVAFIIQMNADGTVTLTQNVPLEHNDDGGPAPTDHNDSLDLDGLINATISITDGDGDTASAEAPIGDNLIFLDDGPNSEVNAEIDVPTLTLDETRPEGDDSDSGDDDPAGLASVTAGFASNFKTADHGADGAGTVAYTLVLAAEGAASGLYALDNTDTDASGDGDGYGQGDEILMFTELDGSITGRLTVDGDVYFTISADGSGNVTFEQSSNVWHANTDSDDDTSELSTASETLQLVQTVTDADGDFDTAAIDLSDGVFFIEDDGPEVLNFTDAQGDNTGLTPTAEGIFDFDIGTDSPNGGNDDIFIDPTSVVIEINNVVIDPADITFTDDGEDADFANYSFSFPYDTGVGGEAIATGTLVFDKNAGTYVVTLTSGPIEGFSTLETADGTAFVGYALNDDPSDPDVLDNTQPQVAVTTILEETDPGVSGDGFYVQFTGFTAGNGSHETIDYDLVDPSTGNDVDSSWTAGELFSEGTGATALTQSWVSVSGSSNGVAGDTVNGPDALNFSLYNSDPGGTFGGPPTANASDMFLVFDGVDSGDDFIVVLKLFDPDSGEFTTKSIVVEGGEGDIYFFGAGEEAATVAALAGTPYEGVVADIVALGGSNNNDGLVIIESNDYNTAPGDNWVIVGAQIVNTNAGVSGTGINLDGGVGDDGDSTGTQAFSGVADSAPMKITNIGFLAGTSNDQAMEFSFDVTITDADGDSQTTSLTATIGEPPVETLAASTMMVSSEPANDTSSFSLLVSDSQDQQLQKTAANSNSTLLAAAVAAAGFAGTEAAASPPADDQLSDSSEPQVFSTQVVEQLSADDGGDAGSSVAALPEAQEADEAPGNSGGNGNGNANGHDNQLDAGSNQASDQGSAHQAANDDGPAADAAAAGPVAPSVAMVSAEAMQAAGLDGNAQHGGSVEKILADALGHGGPPTVDGLLQAITGHGGGAMNAIAHVASPAADAVPAWDMGSYGAFVPGADMMFRMGAEMLHHDAVQPVVNG